jgi:microcystin-dependent protein
MPLNTIHPSMTSGLLQASNNLSEIAASSANQEAAMGNLKLDNAVPIGVVFPYAGTAAPNGWLVCDGSSRSTTTYAALFAVVGYSYGGSGGSFNLPDLRGRVVAGRDVDSGGYGNRLSATHFGQNSRSLGQTGGSEGQSLTTAQLAAHTHFVANTDTTSSASPTLTNGDYIAGHNTQTGGSSSDSYDLHGSATVATVGLSSSAGSGSAHNNVQPTIILNYIIKVRFDATTVAVP